MKTKTLSERIEELNKIKKSYEFEPTNNEFFKAMKVIEELQAELKNENDFKNCFRYHNERLILENEALSERIEELKENYDTILETHNHFLNKPIYKMHSDLEAENAALLAKNKELEEELEERKAYIVANPCAQCGGKINAIKCDAWAKKAKELEEKLKNNDMSKPEPKIDMKEAEKSAMDAVKDALKCGIKQMKDFNAKLDKKYPMSKPEPKKEIKIEFKPIPNCKKHNKRLINDKVGCEECVEPVSIWKDVSELPEVDHDCVICTNRGKMAFAMYQHTDKSFTYQVDETDGSVSNGSIKPHEMYKYTTLTDFVNQVEDMEARLRKLEGK